MKLTNLSKVLIVIVLMVAFFFLFRYLLKDRQADQSGSTDEARTEQGTEAAEDISRQGTRSFIYEPVAPVKGSLKGVVELGAAGFNSFIIRIDRQRNWKLEKAEWGNSLVYDGLASGEDISKGLKKYIADMLDYGVPGKEIHFVVSSGAKTVPATQTIINELKKMNYVVNTVTPVEEAQFALKSVLPPSFEDRAFVVDIGSGNSKISWIDGGRIIGKESYGAKYYVNNIEDQQAYEDAFRIGKLVPSGKTGTCFIIGGVPFSLAKMDRKGEERYTQLRDPGEYEADGAKMQSGLTIYKGLAESTGCKTFVFDWDANFTIGFLLSL